MKKNNNIKIKCLLIQPIFSELSFWNYSDICKIAGAKYPEPPLSLLTVAAILPQQWDFKLIDENVEKLSDDDIQWADLICVTGMLPQQNGILKVIDRAHRFKKVVVIGGADATAQPDIYTEADYIVCGEGEVTIPLFLNDYNNGIKHGKYISDEKPSLSETVIPRFDLIDFKKYQGISIQYSRGCPYSCEFCNIIELYGNKVRTKDNQQVINELQCLYDLGYRGGVSFVDDNFIGNRKQVMQLLPVIADWQNTMKHPFHFSTEVSINLADDAQILELMQRASFKFAFIGLETPSEDILTEVGKKQNINRDICLGINKIQSFGIHISAGFILGFDGESDSISEQMIKLIQDSNICISMVGLLAVLPNTKLHKRLKQENRLIAIDLHKINDNEDFDQLTSGLNFITTRKRIKILKDYSKILKSIYNSKNYYKRIIKSVSSLNTKKKIYGLNIKYLLKYLLVFLKLTYLIGIVGNKQILYWKLFFTILFINPKAIEVALTMAAMFIHLEKTSKYVIQQTEKKIELIEKIGEEKYIEYLTSQQ